MKKKYDYIIIGAGWGGLSQAALHAKDGKKVLLLESYDRAGGLGHSFTKGKYSFCAEMQYLQGCQPGWKVYEFLKKLGLEKEIQFNSLDQYCFDKVVVPGIEFEIPLGVDNYLLKLIEKFPSERSKLITFFNTMRDLVQEGDTFNDIYSVKGIISKPFEHIKMIRYMNWSLQDYMDHLKLPSKLQTILASQVGDVALSPKYVSMEAHSDIIIGYGSSASFPKKGMGYFVDRIVQFIKEKGGEIHFNTPVNEINVIDNKINYVSTKNGSKYFGKKVISNLDPQVTYHMLKGNKHNKWFEHKIKYSYSSSCFTVFLGIEGIDIKKYGFGRWNIWHYASKDINGVLENMYKKNTYKSPFLFISTPSLYADEGEIAPKNGHTMQIVTVGDFDYFNNLHEKDVKKYEKEVKRCENEILDYVEKKFIPKLKKHIKVKEVWSPLDLQNRVKNPKGNIYGEELIPKNLIFHKVSQETPISNLFLVGATTGYPGLLGVITGSLKLYKKLK